MSTELIEPETEEITDEVHLASVMREIRANIASQTRVADSCEALLRKVPREHRRVSLNERGMDFFNRNHEESIAIMRHLALGRWDRNVNAAHSDRVDYHIRHEGLEIRIWGATPPASCRIIEEEVEVPAQTIIKRRLICSPE